jgi:hypothetical protein
MRSFKAVASAFPTRFLHAHCAVSEKYNCVTRFLMSFAEINNQPPRQWSG